MKPSTVVKVKKVLFGALFCLGSALGLLNGKVPLVQNAGEVYRELFIESPTRNAAADAASKGKVAVATHA
jgi:hypothetical protein